MPGRATGESLERPVRSVELGSVTMRLLEVVADDLVRLDEIVGREPIGETFV